MHLSIVLSVKEEGTILSLATTKPQGIPKEGTVML
jgi:hypothetical protein